MGADAALYSKGEMSPWRAPLSGLCASLIGIGLSRFAYTPLIPPLVTQHWFSPSQAAYLGAANLAGYLAGALLGRPIALRTGTSVALRAMMVVATLAFFACGFPLSYLWFFVWRVLSGLSGGVLMVLAAPTVLAHVPPARRGVVGGVIFTGIGLGIAASGSLVPLLLRLGLVETWCGLGALSLLLTAIGWSGWPAEPGHARQPAARRAAEVAAEPPSRRAAAPELLLKALFVEYGLNAFGLVPHMVFLVDFVARGLGQGLDAGARYWVVFGLGALAGPILTGHLGDLLGFRLAVRLSFLVQAAAVALLAVTTAPVWLLVSSFVVGMFPPGIVPVTLGRIHELLPHDIQRQKSAWSVCTTAFAIGQALAGYGLAYIFAQSGERYATLFAIGAGAFLLAILIELGSAAAARRIGMEARL